MGRDTGQSFMMRWNAGKFVFLTYWPISASTGYLMAISSPLHAGLRISAGSSPLGALTEIFLGPHAPHPVFTKGYIYPASGNTPLPRAVRIARHRTHSIYLASGNTPLPRAVGVARHRTHTLYI